MEGAAYPTDDGYRDLLGRTENSLEPMVAIVKEVCAQSVDVADGLVFEAGTVIGERITEAAEYEGVRLRFQGRLGTARVPMQLDVGFGDIVVPSPVRTKYPTILDLPAPELLGYTRESLVAEKLEAMVKLGELNSRMKDFFDIWLLSGSFDFEGRKLADAIATTFKKRGTPIPDDVPVALAEDFASDRHKQAQWAGFVQRLKLPDVPSLSAVVEGLRAFLLPPMHALKSGAQYDLNWIAARGVWLRN